MERISATDKAFAALRLDKAVVAWGEPGYGGDASAVAAELASGVVSVHGNDVAFAAVKESGAVVAWGAAGAGGTLTPEMAQTITEGGGVEKTGGQLTLTPTPTPTPTLTLTLILTLNPKPNPDQASRSSTTRTSPSPRASPAAVWSHGATRASAARYPMRRRPCSLA